MMKPKDKLLITGGFGFIGKNLIELLYSEYKIVVIDKTEDSNFVNKYNIKFYFVNLLHFKELNDILILERPNYVINLASVVTAEREFHFLNIMLESNLAILVNLYEGLKQSDALKLFIQFGSGEEYGNIASPFKESDRECPNSPYALAKQVSTNFAMMLFNNKKFPVVVVRPGNLFGKYQSKDKFISYMIGKLKNNEVVVTTGCDQKRDFIYIKTFCKNIKLLLKSNVAAGEIFNISSGNSYALKEIIEYLRYKIKSKANVKYSAIPYRNNEIMDFKLDNSKFNSMVEGYASNFWNDLSTYIEDY